MFAKLERLKPYKVVVTPLIITLLVVYSWDYLLALFDIPIPSLLLMLMLGAISLLLNSLVIKRVTYRFRKYVSVKDSLWMTSVGILGNSLGLPIGTGAKYYFWVTRIGLKIKSSLLGIGYFSLLSFGSASIVCLGLLEHREAIDYLWLALLLFIIVFVCLAVAASVLVFDGSLSEVVLDWALAFAAVSFMSALFALPLAYYYPHIAVDSVFMLSFGFLALSYLTFVSSIPAGQELLSGAVALFLGDDFMLGVGVSLSVRMIYVVCAGVVALCSKADRQRV
ncbi:MAG: hypothetical protein ACRBBW_00575 [Cellvibrionaceae bacterium]